MDAEHAEVEVLPGRVSGDLLSVLGPDGFQLRPAPDVRLLKIFGDGLGRRAQRQQDEDGRNAGAVLARRTG